MPPGRVSEFVGKMGDGTLRLQEFCMAPYLFRRPERDLDIATVDSRDPSQRFESLAGSIMVLRGAPR
jgi:hypothetical protein